MERARVAVVVVVARARAEVRVAAVVVNRRACEWCSAQTRCTAGTHV